MRKLSLLFIVSAMLFGVSCKEQVDHSKCAPKDLTLKTWPEQIDDMKFSANKGFFRPGNPWPSGVIPYEIESANPDIVEKAVAYWNQTSSSVKLVRRNQEDSYINFVKEDGCWSYVGMIGGKQNLSLADGCSYVAAIHEIGHAFGLIHEHQRPDQNQNVDVNWCFLDDSVKSNFKTVDWGRPSREYDFKSVMHYTSTAFSTDGKKETLVAKNGMGPVPKVSNSELSEGDLHSIEELYP